MPAEGVMGNCCACPRDKICPEVFIVKWIRATPKHQPDGR